MGKIKNLFNKKEKTKIKKTIIYLKNGMSSIIDNSAVEVANEIKRCKEEKLWFLTRSNKDGTDQLINPHEIIMIKERILYK